MSKAEGLCFETECRGCDYLREDGCHYEGIMACPLPCPPGRRCHFNPRQPSRMRERDKTLENGEWEVIKVAHEKLVIDEEKALALYHAGAFDKEIAAHFGCSVGPIQKWRTKNGLPSNKKKRPAVVRIEDGAFTGEPALPAEVTAADFAAKEAEAKEMAAVTASEPAKARNIITLLREMSEKYPNASLLVDGLPVKSVTVLDEFDLAGQRMQTQINLLSD